MGLISRVSSRTYRKIRLQAMDINNWVNNKGGFAFKEPTLPSSLQSISAKTGEKSIAESRAESRSTYRSITSKLDRRKIKRQALLDKLQYEADLKKGKSGGLSGSSGPASGAQADIGIHYLESKRAERRQNKKMDKSTGKGIKNTMGKNKASKSMVGKSTDIESNLKQVKKNKFKRGHQANKHKASIMQIQAMQAKMAGNQGKGAISEMIDSS